MTGPAPQPFDGLSPDLVLAAVERLGVRCDGHFLALNSYENRVYQVGVEDGAPLVTKFYRPARWSSDAILEEHRFTRELADLEIPVAAPLADAHGDTLLEHEGFRYAVFPRRHGRWPELDDPERRRWLGRFIGRIHAVGAVAAFEHRPRLGIEEFAVEPRRYLLENGFVAAEIEAQYAAVTEALVERVRAAFDDLQGVRAIRLHGDCHPGNVLWSEEGPAFVDLDDTRSGPAVQDLWMLLSGDRGERRSQLADLVDGYRGFHDFDGREIALIEPLRALRLVHYAAWLARRWDDPAFPLAFPWFGDRRYWDTHVDHLREQLAVLDEPPLEL